MTTPIRTRFAPSPTGYLHIGGARTALFSWAYARHHRGEFILRIEDTDLERSTQESVDAILQAMDWLNLHYDNEEVYYQTKRFDRYKEVIRQLLNEGKAYYCYTSKEELEAMREEQRKRGEKPRYDGRCRELTSPPSNASTPVIRFKNPLDGEVVWQDLVKGEIRIRNKELDDLIIARADGTPTYNFCVVVDDWDMGITHVIRGDDHVNNTPRQINILEALGAEVPQYAHVPMILGDDGERMSKRHGAVSVMQYKEDGFLPEALLNYLARLSWSHGDDEIFSLPQFIEWFDLDHVSGSPAQFDFAKLRWLNGHYLKETPVAKLIEMVKPALSGVDSHWLSLAIETYRERSETLVELLNQMTLHIEPPMADKATLAEYLKPGVREALADFASRLQTLDWKPEHISLVLKATLADHQLKMPALAMPIRLLLTNSTHTPSVDRVMALTDQTLVMERLKLL